MYLGIYNWFGKINFFFQNLYACIFIQIGSIFNLIKYIKLLYNASAINSVKKNKYQFIESVLKIVFGISC